MTFDELAWMRQAWCARIPDLPWRTDTRLLPRTLIGQMAGICAACPVRHECAAYADQHEITGGFWAGADRALTDVWVDQPLPGLGGDAA